MAMARSAMKKATILGMKLRQLALEVLCIDDAARKVIATRELAVEANDVALIDVDAALSGPPTLPGRPSRPRLVPPAQVPRRSPFTVEGRAALLHAIAHIEFNAINLALDALWRYAGMPQAYYRDWLRVAAEEALHFTLLREHLHTLGVDYGDFDAHDGLWSMTHKTKADIIARMALVPRTLEARGLDATPPMQSKLRKAGDLRAVEILAVILHDEVGHVAIGNRWYRWLCERDGLEPMARYAELAKRYDAPRLKAPFNIDARMAAGFSAEELALLARE